VISSFFLYQPNSLEDACRLLRQYGEEARILAGGSELILLLKLGLASPRHIIDIKRIPNLDRVEFDSTGRILQIGALATHRAVERSETVRKYFPQLVEMERQVANVRVRNIGTLGGNLCFAEPHADPGTLLFAYGAKVKVCSSRGQRVLELSSFFLDYYETALQQDEILTGIEISKLGENFTGTYLRLCPGERPTVAVALLIGWKDGMADDVRLALGCVGPTPIRAQEVEKSLSGRSAREILASALEAGDGAALLCDPVEDIWGSAEYKRQIVRVFVTRGLSELCKQKIVQD